MNKEQVIEEMAIVLSKVNCKPEGCGYCYLEYGTLENSCEEYLVYKKMAIALYNAGYRKERQGECPYCKDRTTTELPLKTNCDTSRVGVLIAQGDKKKEIVFWSQIGTYGIEINYCPICGAKMRGE